MHSLWLYRQIDRIPFIGYRGKIMFTAFLGVHVPLLTLFAFFVTGFTTDFMTVLMVMLVALAATLAGTGVTLFVLNELLRPIRATALGLRDYVTGGKVPDLPTHYTDDAGTLMADALFAMRRLDETIDELASYDSETSLRNRDYFIRGVDDIVSAEGFPAAVLHIAIENLGRIKASADGSVARDMLRRTVSATHNLLPAMALLGRVGDHAIAALLPVGVEDDLEIIATNLRRELEQPFRQGDTEVAAGVRIGIAVWPQDAASAEELVRLGEAALAHRRDDDASGVTFFNPDAAAQLVRGLEIESGLRTALAESQFELHYQPVVDYRTQRVVSAEALIRWNHPADGMISPDSFIPVAEQSGQIIEIGRWVMREACAQLKKWQDDGVDLPRISVNLSARQFGDPQLEEMVDAALKENGLAPGVLQLEITESAAMANLDYTQEVAQRLRSKGIVIALDDFGTGHCSMNYLRRLPVDVLKIDRSFVTNVNADVGSGAICEAVVALARGMGVATVAEGVETPEELAWLSNEGCHVFQGYYFAKPLSSASFATTIRNIPALRRSEAAE